MRTRFGFLLAFLSIMTSSALAQTTSFTYQGKLIDNGLGNAAYDMQFKLFDGGLESGLPLLTFDQQSASPLTHLRKQNRNRLRTAEHPSGRN